MNIKVLGIGILLIVLWAVLAIAVPESFLTGNNIENLLRRTAMYGILGIGVSFVIITAGIDLSIGSMVCLSACFLTIFLKVDYLPFEGQNVLKVEPDASTIIVEGQSLGVSEGDNLRYYGGRRARSSLVKVTTSEETVFNGAKATKLTVEGLAGNSDDRGTLARVHAVQATSKQADSSSVTLSGQHTNLAARDRITFVHPESGLADLGVASILVVEGSTKVALSDELVSVDEGWFAMPVERKQRMPILLALGLVVGIGLVLGLFHGLLVTQLKLQPFVVTLCGLLFYRGISRWSVDDQTVGMGNEYDSSLAPLASGKFAISPEFGIPYPFFILILVAVLAAVFLNRTIYGRYMLALGRNEEAARLSGINTSKMTIIAYIICTGLAAVGGILFAIDSNSVAPSSFGNFFELYAIAAAVLGGCSLRGGEGGILGVVIGTAVMQTLYNLIVLMKISDTLEFAIIGAVILIGVIADEVIKRVVAQRRQSQSAG